MIHSNHSLDLPLVMAPSWEQTVTRKRQSRDHAIQSFLDAHNLPAAASLPIDLPDDVDGIQKAIASGAVTSTQLCVAYIHR